MILVLNRKIFRDRTILEAVYQGSKLSAETGVEL